ncbi:hypothetical protein HD806DRAFT_410872 [Xylariaceae sp. AK1471]|nr:hypothetical protein HD806DRAFT_410872 [Xylariaceae sp. AK1471]
MPLTVTTSHHPLHIPSMPLIPTPSTARVELGTFGFRFFAKRLPSDTAPEKYVRCTIEWREPEEALGETFLGRRLRLISPRGTRHGMLTEVAEICLVDHITALEYQDYSLDGRVVEVSPSTFVTHGKIKVGFTEVQHNKELPAADKTARPAIKVELED